VRGLRTLRQLLMRSMDIETPAIEIAILVIAGGIAGAKWVESQHIHTRPRETLGQYTEEAMHANGFLAEGIAQQHGRTRTVGLATRVKHAEQLSI
jgi:hypothetical protein